MATKQNDKLQGEGNYDATRQYNVPRNPISPAPDKTQKR